MTKAKPKTEDPFEGRWRIVSMLEWDADYIDAEEEGFFEFTGSGGKFHFGYVQGQMDCRPSKRGEEDALEWTWEGNDEMESAQGRGWAVIRGDELRGMIFFHEGDDSEFVARRATEPKPKKKRP